MGELTMAIFPVFYIVFGLTIVGLGLIHYHAGKYLDVLNQPFSYEELSDIQAILRRNKVLRDAVYALMFSSGLFVVCITLLGMVSVDIYTYWW